jgi:hypothetical protein
MKNQIISVVCGLYPALAFGLALETAQVTFEDPNPGGANFPPLLPGAVVLDRVDWDGRGNLGVPYVSDVAVDIFTRYISTPALGPLANLHGNLVDINDVNGHNTIDPLINRLRNFYAVDLETAKANLQAVGYVVPNHLSIAAVTIVSHIGQNQNTLPNGERFQFSTYFLDHLFISGDRAHALIIPYCFLPS